MNNSISSHNESSPIRCEKCKGNLSVTIREGSKAATVLLGTVLCVGPAMFYLIDASKRDAACAKAGVPTNMRQEFFWNGTLTAQSLGELNAAQIGVVKTRLESAAAGESDLSVLIGWSGSRASGLSRGSEALLSILGAVWIVIAVWTWRRKQREALGSAVLICKACSSRYAVA